MKVVKVDDVEVYRVSCGWCGKKFHGLTEAEAKRKLIEHLDSSHY